MRVAERVGGRLRLAVGVHCGREKERTVSGNSPFETKPEYERDKKLTSLHPHHGRSPIDPVIARRRVPHLIVSEDERIRRRAIVRDSEMVNALTQALLVGRQLGHTADIPLESNFGAAFDLVVEALARGFFAVQHEVVEEGGDGVFGYRGVGELPDLELG